MVREFIYILAVFAGIGILSSCQDEPIMQGRGDIPEGNAIVSASVSYKPFGSTLGDDSRAATAGNAIKDINTLYVLLYDEGGNFVTMFNAKTEAENYTDESHNYTIPETVQPENEHIAESSGKGATFKKVVPYGRYRIYAVANVDMTATQYSESIKKESGLKSISFNWDSSAIGNNNQMFGFFSTETSNNNVSKPSGFEAPVVTIASPTVSLHAWIRRLASKVTIAYDGSNLNENVYIYIHSAQIIDIPKQCLLGALNTPNEKEQLMEGANISYRDSEQSNLNTAGITITKGNPKGGSDHSETSDALFFYENIQPDTEAEKGKYQDETGLGTVTHPDGNNETDPDYKDGVDYGSYIEVKGYYVNKNPGKASVGEITYRFMLGKDAIKNCEAERNYHYKLTLKFKNDANNPDWHIVYEPENPTISVPSPLYISYGYNDSIHVEIAVSGVIADNLEEVPSLKANLSYNPWWYEGHKYGGYQKSEWDEGKDGFLVFKAPDSPTMTITTKQREEWKENGFGHVDAVNAYKYDVDRKVAYYCIPIYTRPLILSNSLTGHNPYVSYERKANVQFQVTVDGYTYDKTIDVIQVKRLVNPTGIWRSSDNAAPFNVRLMELNEPDTGAQGMIHTNFVAPKSDGPWTAHIEKGSSWVRIAETGTNNWGTDDVVGGTGSEIRFDYKPDGVNNTGNVRCGVIKITYHNNHCVHYVFVSQGNGTVNIKGAKWQNRNVLAQNQLVDNPLMEGSMFKFGNPWYGILVENNYQEGYGFDQTCWEKTFVTTHNRDVLRFDGPDGIGYGLTGFTDDRSIFSTNVNIKPASYAQWKAVEDLPRRYGVMYGDECTETKTTTTDAYSYWQVGQKRGMQGMFLWDNTEGKDGNHIFFPIGSTGYGHRKVNDNAYLSTYGKIDKYSLLKYAQRPLEMPQETAFVVPMYYDLWFRKGAIYWYDVVKEDVLVDGVITDCYAHDINFHTMLLNTFGSNAIGQAERTTTDTEEARKSTDACYIRCVEP